MQILSISFIYPSSSKFIFTKATKCAAQSNSWLKKKGQVYFSHQNPDTNTKPGRCIPLINRSMFSPQGGVYRHFFTFKTFKESLTHFHSMQFSLWHHGYKWFSI